MKSLESIQDCTVLVVDDEVVNIQLIGSMLGALGMNVMPARSAAEAISRLESKTVDLILLDLMMEPVGGLELCIEIHSRPEWSDIPIIFLSAFDDKAMIIRALESGGVDYITKPFNQSELISRVKTHLVLKLARDRMKILLEDRVEMMGIMAHDCKNHLAAIQMSAKVLHQKTAENHELQDLVGNIVSASTQLLNFLKEFLANSSIDPVLKHHAEVFCPRQTLEEMASRFQHMAKLKEQTFHFQIHDGDYSMSGNPLFFGQILDNLVSNAIKFSQRRKRIEVQMVLSDGRIVCEIRDEGPGFSPSDRSRLFLRYKRLSARPTEGEPSSGLGLSIVKKLVDSMKGTIDCMSEPGKGTTFRLAFPCHASPQTHSIQPSSTRVTKYKHSTNEIPV